jgi:hypothetical protein
LVLTDSMGKKTGLHIAAKRGDGERLQRLLDSGLYDVSEGDDEWSKVSEKREREIEGFG